MDAEYNAMRRRMSRLRFQQGKAPSMEAEDVDESDPGFRDLVRYWKKHGIPVAKDMMPDLLEEEAKAAAKQKGRRRSRELEDLHMTTKGGRLKLKNPGLEMTSGERIQDRPHKINHVLANKRHVMKRSTSDNAMALRLTANGTKSQAASKTTSTNNTPPTQKRTFHRSYSQKT